jgi:hypothetical protein
MRSILEVVDKCCCDEEDWDCIDGDSVRHAIYGDCGNDYVPRSELEGVQKQFGTCSVCGYVAWKDYAENREKCQYCKVTKERDAMRVALEYVKRWWDETGRDGGWHKSVGQHIDRALSVEAKKVSEE